MKLENERLYCLDVLSNDVNRFFGV